MVSVASTCLHDLPSPVSDAVRTDKDLFPLDPEVLDCISDCPSYLSLVPVDLGRVDMSAQERRSELSS